MTIEANTASATKSPSATAPETSAHHECYGYGFVSVIHARQCSLYIGRSDGLGFGMESTNPCDLACTHAVAFIGSMVVWAKNGTLVFHVDDVGRIKVGFAALCI
jgi:hypothetical protein